MKIAQKVPIPIAIGTGLVFGVFKVDSYLILFRRVYE